MVEKALRVGIVAGEASGDILAAGLMRAIKQRHPDAVFEGIAGPKMLAQGCKSLFNMEELSVMGLVEVLSRIRRLLFVRKSLLAHFIANPPDVFIGVDAPDFNLGLELRLKKLGVVTVHYVSPTVWAWREKRIFKIAKASNLVLSIFPFEVQLYNKYNIPCKYVGHTLADEVPLQPDQAKTRAKLKLEAGGKILALLPGSRRGEVDMLLDIFIQSAQRIAESIPQLKILIPVVNRERKQQIETYLKENQPKLDIQLVIGHSREVMVAADAVLLASGTAALEAMLCKRPMVVAYRMKGSTYRMMKWLYKAKYFALPNILADELLVPELLQDQVTPDNIVDKLLPMLQASDKSTCRRFDDLHQSLRLGADEQAANAVLELIHA
jgi:lipid-A-disaccharide synthase